MGDYGKEFHLHSIYYKNRHKISAFTSKHIISSQKLMHLNIPVLPEENLEEHLANFHINEVVFAGSNVNFEYLSLLQKKIFSYGIDFRLSEVVRIMLKATKQVIAITHVFPHDQTLGLLDKFAALAHKQEKKISWLDFPDSYEKILQDEINLHKKSHDSRNTYNTFLSYNHSVVIGSNWKEMIKKGEELSDIHIVCPLGNDIPLLKPNIYICVWDAEKAKNYTMYYPGRINIELANIILIKGKSKEEVLEKEIRKWNTKASIFYSTEDIILALAKFLGKTEEIILEKS